MMDHTASSTMDPFCTRLTNRIKTRHLRIQQIKIEWRNLNLEENNKNEFKKALRQRIDSFDRFV